MSCRLGGGMENYPISSGYSCETPSNGYAAQCSSQRHNTSNDITLRSEEITNTSSTEHMMMRNDVNINTANENCLRCVAGASPLTCNPESSRLDSNCNLSSTTRQCLNSRRRTNEDRVGNEEPRGDLDGNPQLISGNNGGRQRRR